MQRTWIAALRVRTRAMSCRHECSCPSQLYHDVKYILARYDAPIPLPTREWIVSELREAIDNAEDDEPMEKR